MKTLFQVSYHDHEDGTIYGTFEDEKLAIQLCEEVKAYLKTIGDNYKEVNVNSYNVFDMNDVIYRYMTTLLVEDFAMIQTEMIEPTYQPRIVPVEVLAQQVLDGHGCRYFVGYGATKEDSILAAQNIYKQLEDKQLIAKIIEQIKEFDRRYSSQY